MQTINIIGGSGFIGTRLALRLKSRLNFQLFIIDKKISCFFPEFSSLCDVRSHSQLEKLISNRSIVINLAAEHRDDVSPVSLYDEVNVEGAKNICSACVKNNINKLIFTSSVAVYGFNKETISESGLINPSNDYGRTKWEAEQIYRKWQLEDPLNRTLVVIRPTVVFGERNRGNFFNLLKQIATGKFLMIGSGLNKKSVAYVENLAAFIEHSLDFKPGIHVHNYVDKPDFTMVKLVEIVSKLLGKKNRIIKIPLSMGILIGSFFDVLSKCSGKKFIISGIRVKKFTANSVYNSSVESTGFIPPVPILMAIENTVRFEFIDRQTK